MSVRGVSGLLTNARIFWAPSATSISFLSKTACRSIKYLANVGVPSRRSLSFSASRYPSYLPKNGEKISFTPFIRPLTIYLFNDLRLLAKSLQETKVFDFIVEKVTRSEALRAECDRLVSVVAGLDFKMIRLDIYRRSHFQIPSGSEFTIPFEINSETMKTLRFSLNDTKSPNYRFFMADLDLQSSTRQSFVELLETAFNLGYCVRFNLLPFGEISRSSSYASF